MQGEVVICQIDDSDTKIDIYFVDHQFTSFSETIVLL